MRQSMSGNLLRKITIKVFNLSTALVLSLTSLSGAAPLIFAQKVFAATSGDVLIVAAMPMPNPSSPEYVTVKNVSGASVNLNNWEIDTHRITAPGDLASGSSATICENGKTANNCTVGYSVSTVGLNNNGDTVTLYDDAHNQIDQVTYTGSQVAQGQEVEFHVVSYNPTVTPQEFTTISDTTHYYKGIDVGFALNNDFGSLANITVKLYSGVTLIGTNTAAQPMLDYYNNGGRSFTTPFVIQKGAYDPTTDTYWTFSSYNWDKNSVPTKVVITATGSNGSDTKENDTLTFGGGSFDSLFPADTTAPGVPTLASPSNGAVINNQKGPDFNFEWNGVSDPSGVTYDWESSLSDDTNGTDGSFTSPLPYQHYGLTNTFLGEGNSGEGTYYWQVRACDGAGNCSNWSAPWKVTIDRTAPAAFSLTGPTPVDNAFENTTNFNFTWDPSSDANGVTYKICRSQNIPVNNVVSCDWGWTVRQSDIDKNGTQYPFNSTFDGSNGNYTWYWQVSATDAAGNTTLSNIGKVTIDTIAPVVSLSLPADGSYLQGSVNPIVGSVQDNNLLGYAVVLVSGTINPSNVNDLETAVLSGRLLSGPNFTTTGFQNQTLGNLDAAAYQDGQYTLVLVAADQAYNISWSLSHVTVDNTAPTIPTLASPSNKSFVNTNNFYFTWNASTDIAPVTYEFIASQNSHETNGVLDTGVWDNIANGNAEQKDLTTPTIHSTGAPDGTWYWQVRAIDAAGNKSGWSNVWDVTIDTKAPVVHITAPTGNLVRGIVTISGTVTDANPDHYYLVVKDSHGHVIAGPGTVYAAGVADYHWNTTKLNDGTYTIDLEARDKANNKDASSVATMQVIVDNTAPTGLANAFPADGTYTTASALTSIDWTDATDANGPVAYYYESSHSSATNADGSLTSPVYQSAALSSSEIPTLGTPEGVYYWHVRAVDAAGNSTAWTNAWKITVDDTAPTAPVASPKADTYTGTQQVTLTSSDSLSGLASIYYTTDGSTPSKTNGTLYTTALSVSNNETVMAIAYDNAGNASAVATFAYTINQPVAPHVLGAATDKNKSTSNDGTDGQVLGDTTTQNNTNNKSSNNKGNNSPVEQTASVTNAAFLGLGWWWLAVLAVLFTLFMLVVAQRSGTDNKRG